MLAALVAIGFYSNTLANWEYSKSSDPFSDDDRSTITANAEIYGNQDVLLLIALKCMDDGLNVVLGHKYLGGDSDGEIRVELRVDKNETYGPKYWKLVSGHKFSWMPMADIAKLVREMRSGNILYMRVVDPADGETLTQSVNLQGFSAAIDKLSCY